MLGLSWVLRASTLGRRIRAVAEDRVAAALLGVDLERTIAATFFIASGLGGAAGVLTGLEYNSVTLDMGGPIELKGLAVIILGGMGSVTGAVVGGFILGAVETLAIAYGASAVARRDRLRRHVRAARRAPDRAVRQTRAAPGLSSLAAMTTLADFYAKHSRLIDQIGVNAILALSLSVSLQAGPARARASGVRRHRGLRLGDPRDERALAAARERSSPRCWCRPSSRRCWPIPSAVCAACSSPSRRSASARSCACSRTTSRSRAAPKASAASRTTRRRR